MRKIKKLLSLMLSCILAFFVLYGFSGCVRAQELKLAKLPTNGDYIMRSGLFLNQGNTVIDIKEEIRKKIMREKFVLADDADYCYTQSVEKDGIVYFVMKYTAKNREYNNEIRKSESDNYYAFGYTPIFGVDVKIVDYFTLRVNSLSGSYIGLFGDYFVLHFGERDNPKYVVYNIETFERVLFDAQGYIYQTCNDEAFMLTKNDGSERYYHIYDENLSVYEYNKERDGLTEILYGEYLLFYDKNSPEETIQAVRYKTNEVLSKAESLEIYNEMKSLQGNNVGFEYQGKRYKYESEETYDLIPTGEFDENGEEIKKHVPYTAVVFTDIATGETYETTNLKLFERLPNMQDIQKIYDFELNRVGIYLQDGELYFLFWNDDSFFGLAIFSKATPQMVYKYDDNAQTFEYIGFAYRGITQIYEGTL